MKIEAHQAAPEPKFEPIALTITLHTQAEAAALLAVGGKNVTVARMLAEITKGHEPFRYFSQTIAEDVYSEIWRALKPLLGSHGPGEM